MSRYLLWLVPFLLTSLLLLFTKDLRMSDEGQVILTASLKADVEMKGIRFLHHKGDQLRLIICSDRGFFFEDGNELRLERLRSTLFDGSGKRVTAKADEGIYTLKNAKILLKGHVLLETEDGDELKTSELSIDHKKMVMRSNRPVIFQRSGLLLKGKGFEYDFKTGKLVIHQQRSIIKGNDFAG